MCPKAEKDPGDQGTTGPQNILSRQPRLVGSLEAGKAGSTSTLEATLRRLAGKPHPWHHQDHGSGRSL